MSPHSICSAAALVAVLALPSLTLAAEVADPANGLTFTPPEGYRESPGNGDPATLHSFTRGTQGEGSYGLLVITSLGAPLAQDSKVIPEVVERSAREAAARNGVTMKKFEYRTTRWGEHTLETVVAQTVIGDEVVLTLATQVPLARAGVQVMLGGPASDEATLTAEHAQVLASLKGRSNWRSQGEQRDYLLGVVTGLVAMPALGLLGLFVIVRRSRKRAAARPHEGTPPTTT